MRVGRDDQTSNLEIPGFRQCREWAGEEAETSSRLIRCLSPYSSVLCYFEILHLEILF